MGQYQTPIFYARLTGWKLTQSRSKAVLKHTHSKRWREDRGPKTSRKRLECVRFTAAFPSNVLEPWLVKGNMDCGGRAQRRHRFGVAC
jgi:hypothetical protein